MIMSRFVSLFLVGKTDNGKWTQCNVINIVSFFKLNCPIYNLLTWRDVGVEIWTDIRHRRRRGSRGQRSTFELDNWSGTANKMTSTVNSWNTFSQRISLTKICQINAYNSSDTRLTYSTLQRHNPLGRRLLNVLECPVN